MIRFKSYNPIHQAFEMPVTSQGREQMQTIIIVVSAVNDVSTT